MNIKIQKVLDLNKSETKSVLEVGLKLSEEVGELAQAILSSQRLSGAEYKGLSVEDVKEESVDVIICALSIFLKSGGSLQDLQNLIDLKCHKWEQKQSKT